MKGSFEIYAKSGDIEYSLKLRRNITVIDGDSGTGKTTFCSILKNNPKNVHCKVPLILVPTDIKYVSAILAIINAGPDRILVFDDPDDVINNNDVVVAVQNSGCYCLFFSHNTLRGYSYSVAEIYEMRVVGTSHFMCPLYPEVISTLETDTVGTVITEDSGAGRQMLCRLHSNVLGSSGRADVIHHVTMTSELILVDGAAFGSELLTLLDALVDTEYCLCMPESFEYSILTWTDLSKHLSSEALNAEDTCDYSKYLTWEQYYTDVLKSIIPEYCKSRLTRYLDNSSIISQFRYGLETKTGITFQQCVCLTNAQLDKLKELYPVAYEVYTSGGDLSDVQTMLDDVRSKY